MGGAGGGRRLWVAVVVGLALLAAACSGGDEAGDPTKDAGFETAQGEKLLQFTGTGKVRLGATLTAPPGGAPAPGVLIVPDPGPTTRDGISVGAPLDNLYRDLSRAFVAAGMATFRYDRRGAGASTLEPGQQPTWDEMVSDAQDALRYFSERGEVDGSRLAVVGHKMGGPIALKLAAGDPRVKSVALIASPGRPVVDVWAEEFRALNGQESADTFRALVADLQANGTFPPRDRMRPEHQTPLPVGQDGLYKSIFSVDPVADAPAVKVPVLIALGERSTSVFHEDADRLRQALGGTSEVVVAPSATATLQTLKPPPQSGGGPVTAGGDMSLMGGGTVVADAPREPTALARISSFLGTAVGARPA